MNKKRKAIKDTKCKLDQEKVRRKMRMNPDFISDVLAKAFEEQLEVNLYKKLAYLREDESFLDLGTVRFLVGNGYVMPVNPDKESVEVSEKPQFDFPKQIYRITKKGLKEINENRNVAGPSFELELRSKPIRFFVASFGLIAAIIVAIVLHTIHTHAYDGNLIKALETVDTEKIYTVIQRMALDDNYGLVMFYYSGCSKCEMQIQEFQEVIRILNWRPYLLIDLNSGTVFSDKKYRENLVAAKSYGVETVPEIWLVKKDAVKIRVSYDYTPIDDVMLRIYTAYNDMMKSASRK